MSNQRRRRSDVDRPSVANDQAEKSTRPGDDAIRGRAYEIYEQRGAGDGHDLDDWLEAEHELTKMNE